MAKKKSKTPAPASPKADLPGDLVISADSRWRIGAMNRGHGHYSYAVLDENGQVVVECGDNLKLATLLSDAPAFAATLVSAVTQLDDGSSWADDSQEFAEMKEIAERASKVLGTGH